MTTQATTVERQVSRKPGLLKTLESPAINERVGLVGLALVDHDLKYVDMSEAAARINGLPAAALIGRTLEEVIPRLVEQIKPKIQLVLETGQPVDGITIRGGISPSEDRVWSATFHPVRDAAGGTTAVSCVFHEVTPGATTPEPELRERVAFERFLADLSARFVNVPGDRVDAEIHDGLRQLVEFLDIDRSSLARLTPEGGIDVLASYAAHGVPAVSPGEFGASLKWYVNEIAEGRVIRISGLEDFPPEAGADLDHARAIGLKSHMAIPFSVGGMPLCGLGISTFRRSRQFPDDFVPRLRLIGEIFANALARRDADVRARRMQAELSHVTRVSTVGQLAASIAHEINQPLCAIVSNAQAALRLLAAGKPDLADIRGALRDIAADGKRAGEVVARSHGLLKRRDPDQRPVAMGQVIRDVAALLHSESVIRHVTVVLDVEGSVPDVSGDAVQLQQVVLNLVVNAIEATAEVAEGERCVAIRSERDDARVRVTVRDTGIGLTGEVAARMFEPFFTTKERGLGMGLAINQAIIEAHGGRLWARPNGDRGASVGFDLPCRATDPA